jgi:orotidine-5'-phosphate decarboxylase
MAIEAGSNYLVIGRPISRSAKPGEAFAGILNEIS